MCEGACSNFELRNGKNAKNQLFSWKKIKAKHTRSVGIGRYIAGSRYTVCVDHTVYDDSYYTHSGYTMRCEFFLFILNMFYIFVYEHVL